MSSSIDTMHFYYPGEFFRRRPPKKFPNMRLFRRHLRDVTVATWAEDFARTHSAISKISDLDARRRRYGDKVEQIAGWKKTDCFALVWPCGHTEFWVNIDLKQARYKKAWFDYLRQFHYLSAPYKKGDYDLDHLCSKSIAKRRGFAFVRMVPCEYRSNRSWGAFVERMTDRRCRPWKKMRLTTYFEMSKTLGISALKLRLAANSTAERQKIFDQLVREGALHQAEMRASLNAMNFLLQRVG
jgi:hypothetical protein